MRVDCDQDTLWLRATVGGAGAACHTGERSCFYRRVTSSDAKGVRLERVTPGKGGTK
jgi:phosphoribosyl-AMP cyclohydrolase